MNQNDRDSLIDFIQEFRLMLEESAPFLHGESTNGDAAQPNLGHDLGQTEWVRSKVQNSERYTQNLYAALCNNQFVKLDVFSILSDQRWSCSWRGAATLMSRMRAGTDYLDWYCTGMLYADSEHDSQSKNFVAEGQITSEVMQDLHALGWTPVSGGAWDQGPDKF